ncbi:uncharacterized protein METZ01_LOCUS178222 [marine metagenome]|uniref:Uncharacterized protein n=1 Tax=marine metagenome TaxID=408172 RepID=A0A382CGQ9_9ZZZZ
MKKNSDKKDQQESSANNSVVKPIMSGTTRGILAFLILCSCTVLILFTGPGFPFGLQVVLSCLLLFFLFWLATS